MDDATVSALSMPPYTRVCYNLPTGGRTLLCTMAVPVRPGVARVYFKAAFERGGQKPPQLQQQSQQQTRLNQHGCDSGSHASGQTATADGDSAPALEAPAVAPAPPQPVAAKTSRSLLSRLLGLVPHWLLGSQLIADQDVLMLSK